MHASKVEMGDLARRLLDLGADITLTDAFGKRSTLSTCLHRLPRVCICRCCFACAHRHISTLPGRNVLHHACMNGHEGLVGLLLEVSLLMQRRAVVLDHYLSCTITSRLNLGRGSCVRPYPFS